MIDLNFWFAFFAFIGGPLICICVILIFGKEDKNDNYL